MRAGPFTSSDPLTSADAALCLLPHSRGRWKVPAQVGEGRPNREDVWTTTVALGPRHLGSSSQPRLLCWKTQNGSVRGRRQKGWWRQRVALSWAGHLRARWPRQGLWLRRGDWDASLESCSRLSCPLFLEQLCLLSCGLLLTVGWQLT